MERTEIEESLDKLREAKAIDGWFSFSFGKDAERQFRYGITESRTLSVDEVKSFIDKNAKLIKKLPEKKAKKPARRSTTEQGGI